MRSKIRWLLLGGGTLAAVAAPLLAQTAPARRPQTAPETFTSSMQGRTSLGAAAAGLTIRIDRYSKDAERQVITDALKHGGYPGLVKALRQAPAVGHLAIGDKTFPLHWAREQTTSKGRAISLVTNAPVYFLGAGSADAKPRDGFELAVVQLAVDDYGFGSGTFAAAAKVKSDGQGGVTILDYADEPITLTFVHQKI
jgi:hypothetical protein